MKRAIRALVLASVWLVASAHVGNPDTVFDGLAGPYPVRVIVRPPEVVPGIAEVIVRVNATDVRHVSIRPVYWRAGAKGAPPPDEIARVAGSADVYSGQTWFMSRGSYSVYVTLDGARGSGTAIVPVNAFATGRLGLSPVLQGILIVLGLTLLVGLLTIIRAAVGESLVPPGEPFTQPQRRRANIVTAIAVPVLALVVFGGATWWNAVDADYRRTMFYPPTASVRIDTTPTTRLLWMYLHDTSSFRGLYTRVMPDHGKMMHAFLVSRSGHQIFAHLHPIESKPFQFETQLPWIPAGRYFLFMDVVLESGSNITVARELDVPPAPGSVTPSDPDDSWDRTTTVTSLFPGAVRSLGHGYSMSWEGGPVPIQSRQAVDLRFTVRDSSGNVAQLQPYLGMAAHAVIIRHDASVFVHLHPMGTVSTAAQHAFELRDQGDTTAKGRLIVAGDSMRMPPMRMSGTLSFPYEFPKPGRYRVWVQVKPENAVLTGAFDVDVR